MQGDRQPDLQRLIRQLPDLRGQTARGHRDVPRAQADAPRRVDDPDGLQELVVIGQRLAHSHEDEVVHALSSGFLGPQDLLDDLARPQVALPAVQPARAKFAAVGAPHLGRDAERAPVAGLPVQGRGGRNQHGFNELAVRQAEKKLLGGVVRAKPSHGLDGTKGEPLLERLPQGRRQVAHGVERASALAINPIQQLRGAEARLPDLREPGR